MDPIKECLASYRYASEALGRALKRHGVNHSNVGDVIRILHINDAPNDDGISGLYYKGGQAIMRVSTWQRLEYNPLPYYRRIFIIQDLVDASDQQQEEESTG